jgi:hypothetical protein
MIMAVVSADSSCVAAEICSFGVESTGLNRVEGLHCYSLQLKFPVESRPKNTLWVLDFSDVFSVQYADPSNCRLTAAKTLGESGVSGDRIMEGVR